MSTVDAKTRVLIPYTNGNNCYASYCFFVLQALLVATMISSAVGKSVAFSEPLDYVIHITNWSWTVQIVFYTITLIGYVPACVPCAGYIVACLFLPMVSMIVSVAVLVWIMLGTDDENFIQMIFEKIHPGYVMIGNDLVHVLPLLFVVLWAMARIELVFYSLNMLFTHDIVRSNDRCMFLVIVYEIWGYLPLVGIYFCVLTALGTTVNEVYGPDLPVGSGIAISAAVSFVVVGTILVLCGRNYGACRRRTFAEQLQLQRRAITTDFEDELNAQWQMSSLQQVSTQMPRSSKQASFR